MLQKISKYEIRGELGKGGFGQVYLGFDPDMARLVAIKVLSSAEPSLVARFRTEAMAAGNLHHKNLVTIHEFGEDQGVFFLVMEYLEGRDLQRVMGEPDTLTLVDKIRIMSQVAEGLQCAHQNGIVHRDVKPSNIMLLNDGTVKLMDFGIARLTRDESTRLTQSGFLIGTISYMAPEQFNGLEADELCDIWAFGMIYYELVTGQRPINSPDAASAMYRIMQWQPGKISSVVPECPPALDQVVQKLLNKDRELRYQSLEDVLFDTAPILPVLDLMQAGEFVFTTERLIREGKLEQAQQLIRRVLVRDPLNVDGRALRQKLQTAIAQRLTRTRVGELCAKAEEHAARQDYVKAIQSIESALSLDPGNSALEARLAALHATRDRKEKANRLVEQARLDAEQNKLTVAFQGASDALNAEPAHEEARNLLAQLQHRMAEREAQQKLADDLAKVRGLLVLESFDEADEILAALARQAPGSPDVLELMDRARWQREAHKRQRFIRSEIDAAKEEMKRRDFAAAIEKLDFLSAEPSCAEEVAGLLAYARQELAAEKRAAAIKALGREAWSYFQHKQFAEAEAKIDAALVTYPDSQVLISLRQTIRAERAQEERRVAIQAALDESSALERSGELEKAEAILANAAHRFPDETSLSAPRARVAAAREQRAKALALENDLKRTQMMLDQGQSATNLLKDLGVRYPNDPRLLELQERAAAEQRQAFERRQREAQERERADAERRQKEEAERRQREDAERRQKEDAERRQKEDAERRQKEDAERRHREDAERRERDDAERRQREDAERKQREEAERKQREEVGRKQREEAERKQREEVEHKQREEVERKQREDAERKQRQEAERRQREEAERQQLEEAEREREEAARRKREEAERKRREEQERERAEALQRQAQERAERLGMAKSALEQKDWRGVERPLKPLLARDPNDAEVRDLLSQARAGEQAEEEKSRLEASRAEAERRRARERLERLGQARAALRQRDWPAVERALEPLLKQDPNDAEARDLMSEARGEEQADKDRRRLEAARAEAEKQLKRLRFDDAIQVLKTLQTEFPDHGGVRAELQQALDTQQRHLRREAYTAGRRQADALAKQRRFDDAVALLRNLLIQFPGDALLQEDLSGVTAAQQEYVHKERYTAGRKQADGLAKERRFDEAVALLRNLLVQFPGDALLQEDLSGVTAAQQEYAHKERYTAGRKQADSLAKERRFDEAVTMLRNLLVQFPGDALLQEDLNGATAAQQEYARKEHYAAGRQQAAGLVKERRFDEAAGVLRNLLVQFPGDALLQDDLKAAAAAQQESTRKERYTSERRRAGEWMEQRRFDDAIRTLERLLMEFPSDPVLQADLETATGAKRLQERKEAVDQAVQRLEKLYRKGDAKGVWAQASALAPDMQDARIRELMDWAKTELARPQDEERQSSESLRRKRHQRTTLIVAAAGLAALLILALLLSRGGQTQLTALPVDLQFPDLVAGGTPASRTITVDSRKPVHWSATTSDSWLTVQPGEGTTPQEVVIFADPSQLGAGSHSAKVSFSTGGTPAVTTVAVNVRPMESTQARVRAEDGSKGKQTAEVRAKQTENFSSGAVGKQGEKDKDKGGKGDKGEKQEGSKETTVALKETTAPPPPPPPVVDCHSADYTNRFGPTRGDLTWTGNLAAKGDLTIVDQTTPLRGNHLPGCEVTITVTSPASGVSVTEQPLRADSFRRLKLHNNSDSTVTDVKLRWQIR